MQINYTELYDCLQYNLSNDIIINPRHYTEIMDTKLTNYDLVEYIKYIKNNNIEFISYVLSSMILIGITFYHIHIFDRIKDICKTFYYDNKKNISMYISTTFLCINNIVVLAYIDLLYILYLKYLEIQDKLHVQLITLLCSMYLIILIICLLYKVICEMVYRQKNKYI